MEERDHEKERAIRERWRENERQEDTESVKEMKRKKREREIECERGREAVRKQEYKWWNASSRGSAGSSLS